MHLSWSPIVDSLRDEAQLASVFEASPFAVCLIEMPSFTYVWANATYCSLFRAQPKPSEIKGKTVFELMAEPHREAIDALTLAHELKRQTHFELWKSGKSVMCDAYWSGAVMPAYSKTKPDGTKVTGVLSLLVDVTDKVAAEREAKLNLEKFHEERRNREKFLALVAHEFRNPMLALRLLSQLAQKAAKAGDMAKLVSYLNSAEQQVQLLDRMLLEFDNPQSNNCFECDLKQTALNSFVSGLAYTFAEGHPSHRFKIEISDDQDALVLVDPQRLSQVLLNIFINATRYSATGTQIHCKVSYGSNDARIEIIDKGRGIEPENLTKIFDRSFRVSSDSNAPEGSGLGLYVAKEMVTYMGGRVWAESAGLGHGSTFIVELPVTETMQIR